MVLSRIGYTLIFGKPLIFYLGILTFIALLNTVVLGVLVHKGKIDLKYHKISAITTLVLASIHALLALLGNI